MKGEPRHNPIKPQNNYGGDEQCPYFDGYMNGISGRVICEHTFLTGSRCNGNIHNCKSEQYRTLASLDPKRVERSGSND